jgi:hypothetical protein
MFLTLLRCGALAGLTSARYQPRFGSDGKGAAPRLCCSGCRPSDGGPAGQELVAPTVSNYSQLDEPRCERQIVPTETPPPASTDDRKVPGV